MPNTPQGPFTPRKEFLRDQRTTSAFSLLAVSGSSLIRLYSFPPLLITSLRRLFDQQSLTIAFREDAPQCLYEFTLDGKPWSSPKSVQSEKLLVNILSIIYQHGYAFLSTIDYGREHDDRLAIAFSKLASLSSSPGSVPPSPLPNSSASNLSYSAGERTTRKVPFALSFSSATLLRVVNPPLHSTPAILQAVRGSWPRGIVSERKIGDASYEFKLKGYKWFQEDTFASDSLRHILTLLSSLDGHAFTLIASISLINRSRVKDLWIFTGLVPVDTQDTFSDSAGSLNVPSSNGVTLKIDHNAISQSPGYVGPVPQHRRNPTAPTGAAAYPQTHTHSPLVKGHMRSATERTGPPGSIHASASGGILRKPAPRAQVPVSVNLDAPMDMEPAGGHEQEQFRAMLPSVISSTAENMTGVGAVARGGRDPTYTPDIVTTVDGSYAGRFPSPGGPMSAPRQSNSPSPPRHPSPGHPTPTRAKTPPIATLPPPASLGAPRGSIPHQPLSPQQTDQAGHDKVPTPPLLASGVFAGDVFRESATSAASSATDGTDTTQEIPIKWTGGVQLEGSGSTGKVERLEGAKLKRMSTGPHVPGAWTGSPDEDRVATASAEGDSETEKGVDTSATPGQTRPLAQDKRPERPLHDVDARVASPELVMNYDDEMRKSEAGLVGIMNSSPLSEKKEPQPRSPKREGSGNGWVLVNVEGKPRPQAEAQARDRPSLHSRDTSKTVKTSGSGTPNTTPAATMSPVAKSIVIIDAKEAKRTKGRGRGKAESKDSGTDSHRSGLRRLLSFSKRGDALDELAPGSTGPTSGAAEGQPSRKKPSQGRLRDRLKLAGVPEAS